MRIIFLMLLTIGALTGNAQENMHPSPPQTNPIVIKNAFIHVGNGNHIVVSELFYPQLSDEYDTFDKVKTVWKDESNEDKSRQQSDRN